ncbi:MAG: SH3 domain-containing protein [Lachnospiraceae bacterium]|nr:SH3 domain-containing protein [Lachnospiraceae bacterium]
MAKKKIVSKKKNGVELNDLPAITKEEVDTHTGAADISEINATNTDAAGQRIGRTNCEDLRLRSEPIVGDNIVKLLPKGTELIIIADANEKFYKVLDGYVMKEFVDEK